MEAELTALHDDLESEGLVTLPPSGTRPPASADVASPSDVVKRKRGRPPGSKNKSKDGSTTNPLHAVVGKDNPLLQIVCNNETELGMLLAQVGVFAIVTSQATKWQPVAQSLGWVEVGAGNVYVPTKRCMFASALCWPYIKKSGILDSLDNVPPILLFGLGLGVLIAPAVGPTITVLKANKKKVQKVEQPAVTKEETK